MQGRHWYQINRPAVPCAVVNTSFSLLGDGIDSIDDSWDVAQEGEQEADPELMPASELEEDAERREDDGDEDVDAVGRAVLVRHDRSPLLISLITFSAGG